MSYSSNMPSKEPSSLTGFSYETGATDLLAVLRAVEPVLVTALRSLGPMEFEGYTVMGPGTVISDVANLAECLSGLSHEADTIIEPYRSAEDARYQVDMWVSRNHISRKIRGRFEIHGPHNNETTGFVDQLRIRVRNEVKRQEESDWTAEPLPIPVEVVPVEVAPVAQADVSRVAAVAPPSPSERPVPTSPPTLDGGAGKSLWHTIANQPLVVQIVGGIIATLIAAAIIALITMLL